MHRWGLSPWENRAAANWIVSLQDSGQPVERMLETLHLNVSEYSEEVRAAAATMVLYIEAGRWPDHAVNAGLELAISRLQEICDKRLFGDEAEACRALPEEMRVLRARLLGAAANRAST